MNVLSLDALERVSGGEDEEGTYDASSQTTSYGAYSNEMETANEAYLQAAEQVPAASSVPSFVQYQDMVDAMAPADRATTEMMGALGTPDVGRNGDNYDTRLDAALRVFDGLSPELQAEVGPRFDDYRNNWYTPSVEAAQRQQTDAQLSAIGNAAARMPGDFVSGALLGSYHPDPGVVSSLGHAAGYFAAPYAAGARDLSHAGLEAYSGNYGTAALEAGLLGAGALGRPGLRLAEDAVSGFRANQALSRELDAFGSFPSSGVVDVASIQNGTRTVIEANAARDYQGMLRNLDSGLYPTNMRDGAEVTFQNLERGLPGGAGTGYYREFYVPGPVASGMRSGPERLISGRNGEVFYTPDHYRTFVPLR